MTDPRDDKLDRLLQTWARDRSVDGEELRTLQEQVSQRVAADAGPRDAVPLAVGMPQGWRRGLAVGMATAATVLVAVGIGLNQFGEAPPNAKNEAPQETALGPADASWSKHILQQSELLARCQELFDGRLAWLAESGSDSVVELKSEDLDVPEPQFIAIRIRVASRKAGTQQWNDLQTIDVLTRQEEWVEVSMPAAGASRLALWAYPAENKVVSVDLRYASASIRGEPVVASSLLQAARPTTVHSFVKEGVEYQIYQTAAVVPFPTAGRAS